jgi:macrolide transport system ATP-binding/permease protein
VIARSNFADSLTQDIRFAIRQLRKSPIFAATSILTLALGLCGAIAIFAFVDAALIRPLPYKDPSRLVGVFERVQVFPQSNLSYADYLDWKRLNTVFTSLAAYQGTGATLTTAEGVDRVPAARVSDDFFRTLGVVPVLGRDLRPGEDLPEAPRAVLLSYGAWQKRYGGRSDVLGRTVTLNDSPNVIVGVLPRGFHFAPAEPADFWVALHANNPCELRRGCHNLYGVARLRDGVTVEAAAANIGAIASQLEQQYPESNRGQGSAIVPLDQVIVGTIRPVLLLLISGAGLLLLLAAVNVASLLLVRSEGRRRELAVRAALGASSARVFAQFVTEGCVLVVSGSVLALTFAYWTIKLLTSLIPVNIAGRMPFLEDLGLSPRVLVFASVAGLLAVILFAITPALRFTLSDTRQGLAEGSRGSAGMTWHRLASKLVIVEIAMAIVLLVGAGLLGKSLYRLLHVDIGLESEHLATVTVTAPNAKYSKNEQTVALVRQISSRVGSLPGVQSVGISSRRPLVGGNTMWIRVAGRSYKGEHNDVHYREVTASYFATLHARLVRGRHFRDDEDASKPPVVIINQTLARQYFPAEDPLGRQLLYAPPSTQPPMEIVGIVDDIKEAPLDSETPATIYVPFAQDPTNGFSVFVRTSQAEPSVLTAIAAAIHEIDPALPTFGASTMRALVNDSQSAYLRRSSASLVTGFAALAWLLGVVGLYGVVAYSVSQRTREIGVRMALGAQPSAIYALVLREAGGLAAMGVALGLACAVGAATLMRSLLFGVRSWDTSTLLIAAGLLSLSALAASYMPARRAASISPVEALRAE